MSRVLACCLLSLAGILSGQSSSGELRVFVKDESGAAVAATVELADGSRNLRQVIDLPADGRYSFRNLPFGTYRLAAKRQGFADSSALVEIRSAIPQSEEITLSVGVVQQSVVVSEADAAVDPDRTGSVHYIGSAEINEHPAAGLPGRGLLDLIVMQPGWTYESNAVLHPRESEYDTQFVVNGFPVYDNRSPAFAPTVDTDDAESVKVFTSGIPAEFGQKLGGVVEVNTQRNTSPGFHGTALAQGGSFDTAGGFVSGQYVAGRSTATLSSETFVTDRYLDPPTTNNFSNHASGASLTSAFERDLSDQDRLRISVARRQTRFLVPNDLPQQAAGQRQDRVSGDTEGQVSYQRVLSPSLLGSVGVMVRDVSAQLWSNPLATPISAAQDRGFREGYVRASLAGHRRRHEWKVGMEARYASIRERFGYQITSYTLNPGDTQIFDPDVPPAYAFWGRSGDREQSLYAQDVIRLGNLTLSAGLRFDHYSLRVDETAWSPRLATSWKVPGLGLALHGSYDRVFSTPPFENLLVSAAASTAALTGGFYLPVRPARANYYEGGVARSLGRFVRLDASYFVRDFRDFKDDDLLLNTGVSFPISFHSATIRGVEAKLEVPRWGRFSGYLSYSNTIGMARFPVSGGLFLDAGDAALLSSTDRFPISQDIRNAAHAWARYQITNRLWTAWTGSYSSGLPIEGDLPGLAFLAAQYGTDVLQKVNFGRGRVAPSFSLGGSVGAELWRRETRSLTLQADALNLTGRLNLINFAGLLSGTGIGPARSFGLRLRTDF